MSPAQPVTASAVAPQHHGGGRRLPTPPVALCCRFDTPSQQQQHRGQLDAPRRRNQELQPAASAAPQELQEPHQLSVNTLSPPDSDRSRQS